MLSQFHFHLIASMILDNYDEKIISFSRAKLNESFKRHILLCIVIEFITISVCVTVVIIYSNVYVWIMIPRLLLQAIRLILLIGAIFTKHNILYYRALCQTNILKLAKFFKRNTFLGLWMIVGYFGIILLIFTPITNIITCILHNKKFSIQALVQVIIDVVFISEYIITIHLIYIRGVLANINKNLRK